MIPERLSVKELSPWLPLVSDPDFVKANPAPKAGEEPLLRYHETLELDGVNIPADVLSVRVRAMGPSERREIQAKVDRMHPQQMAVITVQREIRKAMLAAVSVEEFARLLKAKDDADTAKLRALGPKGEPLTDAQKLAALGSITTEMSDVLARGADKAAAFDAILAVALAAEFQGRELAADELAEVLRKSAAADAAIQDANQRRNDAAEDAAANFTPQMIAARMNETVRERALQVETVRAALLEVNGPYARLKPSRGGGFPVEALMDALPSSAGGPDDGDDLPERVISEIAHMVEVASDLGKAQRRYSGGRPGPTSKDCAPSSAPDATAG